jgi:hypothetical protein
MKRIILICVVLLIGAAGAHNPKDPLKALTRRIDRLEARVSELESEKPENDYVDLKIRNERLRAGLSECCGSKKEYRRKTLYWYIHCGKCDKWIDRDTSYDSDEMKKIWGIKAAKPAGLPFKRARLSMCCGEREVFVKGIEYWHKACSKCGKHTEKGKCYPFRVIKDKLIGYE